MVFGLVFGTLGSLKMSIWSRRNTHFHFLDPRKCELEMCPRKSREKVRFGMDLELHFGDFCLPKRVQKSGQKKVRKKINVNRFVGSARRNARSPGRDIERG